MGYQQMVPDDDKPRIAYWKCDEVVTNGYCPGADYFRGCGRIICDAHCNKYTEFKKGKRNDRIVKREYLLFKTCFDCRKAFERGREEFRLFKKNVMYGVVGTVLLCVLALIIYTIVKSKQSD